MWTGPRETLGKTSSFYEPVFLWLPLPLGCGLCGDRMVVHFTSVSAVLGTGSTMSSCLWWTSRTCAGEGQRGRHRKAWNKRRTVENTAKPTISPPTSSLVPADPR